MSYQSKIKMMVFFVFNKMIYYMNKFIILKLTNLVMKIIINSQKLILMKKNKMKLILMMKKFE